MNRKRVLLLLPGNLTGRPELNLSPRLSPNQLYKALPKPDLQASSLPRQGSCPAVRRCLAARENPPFHGPVTIVSNNQIVQADLKMKVLQGFVGNDDSEETDPPDPDYQFWSGRFLGPGYGVEPKPPPGHFSHGGRG